MHNNYYFLRQLSVALNTIVRDTEIISCFSQSKDELVLEFYSKEQHLFLVASLQPELQCLSFPTKYNRARKNSIDLFPEIIGQSVLGVRQFTNERSLALRLGETMLIFKMHGKQSNIILSGPGSDATVFRHNLPADLELDPETLDRNIDWSREAFEAKQDDLRSLYITFGRPVWEYLDSQGFSTLPREGRWKLIEETRHHLEHPKEFLLEEEPAKLTLFRSDKVTAQFNNPLEAVTQLYRLYHSRADYNQTKKECLDVVHRLIKQSENALARTTSLLQNVEQEAPYQRWADVLMANLHQIPRGATSVELEDFHNPGRMITIPLKGNMTPQRVAEDYYRKSRSRATGEKKAEETIQQKSTELTKLKLDELAIQQSGDLATLKPFVLCYTGQEIARQKKLDLPYHEHLYQGFTIRVGKNASDNDELTLRHTHKEDLWLHAKDTPGSHVVIRHKAGRPFPKEVIEFAAALAAGNSRRKTDSLCPVAYTPAKYVRKRKGDAPGMVVLQREKVILVEPARK